MNLVFDIFPADDVRGTRLVRLTSDDYLQGTMFRTELVGMGKGRLVLQADQAVATAANLARDNYVEVFDLTLSGAYALGAFFLEEGDFAALSSREQSGRILTFGGRGELSYLSRGVLGPTALSGAHGPLDQHWIDTLGSWKWGSLGSETYGAILRRIIYESALMTPDPLPEVQLVDIGWDDTVDSDAVPWPGFTGEYDIPVGTNLLEAAADLLKYGIELVANSDFEYSAYNAGGYGTNRTSGTFATNKVRFEAGVNIAADLSRAIHGATDASHALLKDRTGFAFELITSPEYTAGDVVRYVGITSPESTGPDDLVALGEGVLTNRRAFVDQFAFPHPTGYTPLSGLYTPGPPTTGAHYWKGDYVTIHTGTSPYDANEQAIRVAAIEWNVDDAGNWLPTVELGAQYLSVGQANIQGQLSSMVNTSHTHPPNPELCRAAPPATVTDTADAEGDADHIDLPLTVGTADGRALYVAVLADDVATVTWYPNYVNTGTPGSGSQALTAIDSVTVAATVAIRTYRLLTPTTSVTGTSALRVTMASGKRRIVQAWALAGASTTYSVATNTGSSSSSSVSPAAGSLVLDAAGWSETNATVADPIASGDQVSDSTHSIDRTFGFPDYGMGGGHGGDAPAWNFVNSHPWAAIALTVDSFGGDGPLELVGTSIRASRCDHAHLASGVLYDNDTSGLTADDVQAALDELASGGGTTIEVEDEGSNEGSIDTLNFTGAGVSVTVTGSEAEVIIPGGGGGGSLTGGSAVLGADVTMTSANTNYDGPSASLAAGTYLVVWKALFQQVGTTRPSYFVKLWDGTTTWDESEDAGDTTAGYRYSQGGSAIFTLGSTTTVKLTVRSDLASQVLKRNGGVSTTHRVTSFDYVKIA